MGALQTLACTGKLLFHRPVYVHPEAHGKSPYGRPVASVNPDRFGISRDLHDKGIDAR